MTIKGHNFRLNFNKLAFILKFGPKRFHKIDSSIRQALPAKENPNKRRNPALDPAIFACISMLARAVKDTIKHEVASMLDAMLSVGLSPSLTTALYELAAHVPAFKKDIAEGLLKILSLILMQQVCIFKSSNPFSNYPF
jgi:hypothetical protein